ncbi:carboxypeptidase-like regulatory domain-containing protein [bacterium]|nr:carboxypeptidase-like regulatory domain-containing protein [bacterium]MDC1222236.1 carboxypeptidase-like regulatory domain-containing protein [Salibacteraceae bacterium]
MRFFIITLFLVAFASVHAQHRIKSAEYLRTGETLKAMRGMVFPDPSDFDAVSDCFPTAPKHALWVELKPKSDKATFVLTPMKKEQMSSVRFYFGRVDMKDAEKELSEISCQNSKGILNKKDRSVHTISYNKFEKGYRYYVLIETEELGELFNLELQENYLAAFDVLRAKEEAKVSRKAFGRVYGGDGKPKPRALITLLDQKMQPIESVESAADGSFKFENLPAIEPVLVRIDEADPELTLELYLVEADGKIGRRANKLRANLFGFELIENSFNDLVLLSENDWKLDVEKGTIGMTGKLRYIPRR